MRRMLLISFIITGAIFSIFVLNVLLYAMVPAYRDALLGVTGKQNGIPVIEVTNELREGVNEASGEKTSEVIEIRQPAAVQITEESTPLSATFEEASEKKSIQEKPAIIERTYYEDCGTGKGYWVIKYADGSYGIE